MVKRIDKKLVTFQFPFSIDEIEKQLPAGKYTIETEEESIEGLSFLAFRRVETTLISRPPIGERGMTQFWSIDPQGLESALELDAARTRETQSRVDKSTSTEPPNTPKSKSELPNG